MLSSYTTRFHNFIWFLIFTFTLYTMPYLETLLPYEINLSFPEAEAAETQPPPDATNIEVQEEAPSEAGDSEASYQQEVTTSEYIPSTPSSEYIETESVNQINSDVLLEVDNFKGVSYLSHPIEVPPGRGGLSPQLSLNYSSIRGNGWLGVGWGLTVGFIQRRGPNKGVPKYDDTKDVFDFHFSGRVPQELVSIGGGEYRLRIEGQYFKIKYYSSGNYWELWDKSGVKMRFGSSVNSRLGRVKNPNSGTDTYQWCLDRIDDPKTNYIEFIYLRDQDQNYTYQIYLQEAKYNGQVSGGLAHNHRIIFSLESSNRPDLIYYYRGGFRMLTKKRLSSIEVRTNESLVRKYQL